MTRFTSAVGVVPGLRLVPHRGAQARPLLDGHVSQVLLKHADAVMTPGAGAQAQADGHRAAQLPGLAEDVLHPHHHRAGGIGVLLLLGDAVFLPLEGPGLSQLHSDDLRVRGLAQGLLRLVEILRLHIAQDAPAGEHLTHLSAIYNVQIVAYIGPDKLPTLFLCHNQTNGRSVTWQKSKSQGPARSRYGRSNGYGKYPFCPAIIRPGGAVPGDGLSPVDYKLEPI